MGDRSKIEWTDATWNPIRAQENAAPFANGWHCEHVTEGCRNCYAERMNLRLGTGFAFKPGYLENGAVSLFLDEKMLTQPLRWKRPRMIFVCSMTDLFADFVEDEWIDKMFAVMALAPQHTFQVLTKRPERMAKYLAATPWPRWFLAAEHYWASEDQWPYGGGASCHACPDWENCENSFISYSYIDDGFLPNVWLGTSVEDQAAADARIPHLLQMPAAVRFLSCEPLLGPVDIDCPGIDWMQYPEGNGIAGDRLKIDWVIAGGESGPGARPMHPDWVRTIRDRCLQARIPFFFKQWGAWGRAADVGIDHLPQDADVMVKVGKGAGRLLHGVEHSDMPARAA